MRPQKPQAVFLSAAQAQARALSDHRKFHALSVPAESQETNTYPTAAACASMFVPSTIDAKFQSQP
jgi:hypothetical protein